MLLNCGAGEDSWESHGLQGDPTSPSWRRSTLNIHWKDGCWSWSSDTLDLMWRADSLEKVLTLAKIGGGRRRGRQRVRWSHDVTDSMDVSWGKLRQMVKHKEAWPAAVHALTESWTLSNWAATTQCDENENTKTSKTLKHNAEPKRPDTQRHIPAVVNKAQSSRRAGQRCRATAVRLCNWGRGAGGGGGRRAKHDWGNIVAAEINPKRSAVTGGDKYSFRH